MKLTKSAMVGWIAALTLLGSQAFGAYHYQCSMVETGPDIIGSQARSEKSDIYVYTGGLFQRAEIKGYLFGNDGKLKPDVMPLNQLQDDAQKAGYKIGSSGFGLPFFGSDSRIWEVPVTMLQGAPSAEVRVTYNSTNFDSGTVSYFALTCTRVN